MPESYSVEQLKTWSKCRKKYELNTVRQLLWPSNPKNFRLGKGVHQLLDYGSRGLPIQPIITATDRDIVEAWKQLENSRWAHLPIIASEWGFSLETNGNWLYGRVDRIVQDGPEVHILDWKTGTGIPLSPEEDWQTVVYLHAVYLAQKDLGLKITPDQLVFTYVQVRKGALKEVRIPYSEAMHQQTAQRLASTLKTIQSVTTYELPPQCPDRYCPYLNICGIKATIKTAPDEASPPPEDIRPVSIPHEVP